MATCFDLFSRGTIYPKMAAESQSSGVTNKRNREIHQRSAESENEMNNDESSVFKRPRSIVRAMRRADLNDSQHFEGFEGYDSNELVSATETYAHLLKIGRENFQQKYQHKTFFWDNCENKSCSMDTYFKMFGDLIKKLDIGLFCDEEMANTICKYSRQSLVELDLYCIDECGFDELHDPFENVTKVSLNHGFAAKLLNKLNKLFPNLQRLDLVKVKFSSSKDRKCIEQRFPALTHLSVTNLNATECRAGSIAFTVENVKITFLLNPKLKSLQLKHNAKADKYEGIHIDDQLLKFVNDHLPYLEALHLDIVDLKKGQSNRKSQKVDFKNLKCLAINFQSDIVFPGIFSDRLEQLKLRRTDRIYNAEHNTKIIEFVSLNKNVRRLEIDGEWGVFPFELMVSKMPKLTEIKVVRLTQAEMTWMMDNCRQLVKLSVYSEVIRKTPQLNIKPDSNWKLTSNELNEPNNLASLVFEKKAAD